MACVCAFVRTHAEHAYAHLCVHMHACVNCVHLHTHTHTPYRLYNQHYRPHTALLSIPPDTARTNPTSASAGEEGGGRGDEGVRGGELAPGSSRPPSGMRATLTSAGSSSRGGGLRSVSAGGSQGARGWSTGSGFGGRGGLRGESAGSVRGVEEADEESGWKKREVKRDPALGVRDSSARVFVSCLSWHPTRRHLNDAFSHTSRYLY